MSPFSVTVQRVPDRELGPLLSQLSRAGFDNPAIHYVGGPDGLEQAGDRVEAGDLPQDWRVVRERKGESYRWPQGRDRYSPYRVFVGTTRAEGAVQVGLGETIRKNRWGRDRKYVVAFLSGGAPQQPLVEFLAADDYDKTHELVAVIRGSDGGRRMYGAGDPLPPSTPSAFARSSTTSGSSIGACGTRSSWSPGRMTTRRSSTTL